MTLIITVGNREQFIQVSDRRLTVNGVMQDDESNKAIVLNCANARLAFGFTGLAMVPGFETRKWLLSTVNECGPTDYLAHAILERVKNRATQDFQNIAALRSLPQSQKRLTVMFSGYLYHHDPPLGVLAILTNFQDINTGVVSTDAWNKFECFFRQEPRPFNNEIALYYAIGSCPAIDGRDTSKLAMLLKTQRPAKAIVTKIVQMFYKLADLREAQGVIGKQLTSIALPRDRNLSAESGYHSNVVKHKSFMPDQIYVVSENLHLNVTDVSVEPVFPESTPPMAGPKLRPNQPCWCKSGKKYKFCHGGKPKHSDTIRFVATPDKKED